MSQKRWSFTTEYKIDAAHRVIDSGRSIAEVAFGLGLNEGLLGRWVAARVVGLRRHTAKAINH